VHIPTLNGRELPLKRCAEPEKDLKLLLAKIKRVLFDQQPAWVTPDAAAHSTLDISRA
jgi:hypothetical protein